MPLDTSTIQTFLASGLGVYLLTLGAKHLSGAAKWKDDDARRLAVRTLASFLAVLATVLTGVADGKVEPTVLGEFIVLLVTFVGTWATSEAVHRAINGVRALWGRLTGRQ
ncbi:MAG: hypothetical protein M0R37_13650 [Bacteroidales bacterium]|jgi:hypothetical protein|nr:hypothetical protein [Sphaerochaeta sp.]MCK9629621.1 hypothetical protein [Bacteroidales bacterium]